MPVFGSCLRMYFNNNGEFYSCKGLWRKIKINNLVIKNVKIHSSTKAAQVIQSELSKNDELEGVPFEAKLMYFELPGKMEQKYLAPVYAVKYGTEGSYALNFVNAGADTEQFNNIRQIDESFKVTQQSDQKPIDVDNIKIKNLDLNKLKKIKPKKQFLNNY